MVLKAAHRTRQIKSGCRDLRGMGRTLAPGDGKPIRIGGAVVLLLVGLLGCSSRPDVEQPIAFNHRIHVAQEEISCTECHRGAEESDHATFPEPAICLECHEEPLGDSPEEAKLVALLAGGEAIEWRRVTRLEDHVHFSHRRHILAGRILCETCHGDVHTREQPFARPHLSFEGETGMERCIDCHQASGNPRARIDCALCHR